ncbi:hypothetical protein L218DRAFT_1000650 [Marasmius fiardii PR-910]|nr:hypothetical protein L218DRAFT_1000650 [Marasmius fiardii PR-910]
MEVLTGATGVTIDRSHFSNVGRDQYNNYTIRQTIVQTGHKRRVDRGLLKLSEFTEVKRGDIYKDTNVCHSWKLFSNGKDETEAAIYYAEINTAGSFGQRKFTIKAYHGRNAKKEWERDFLKCYKDWTGDIPLFGYNRSPEVPLLIFYGELVPFAHIQNQVGNVGRFYLELLKNALGCSRDEVWLDPIKGRFCRGPAGPQCLVWFDQFDHVAVPSDAEFLKEDVVIRYFSSIKYDSGLLGGLHYSSHTEVIEVPEVIPRFPIVISSLTNSVIAFARDVRWWSCKGCLGGEQMMSDGATRFRLAGNRRYIEGRSNGETHAWLSQALSVFRAHNIQLGENYANYNLIYPSFRLTGTLQRSKCQRQRRRLYEPIYFFVLPSPSFHTPFYFWTLDPLGRYSLSPAMCKYLGLPLKISLNVMRFQESWPTKVYEQISAYQIARGFDPKTTDFARSFGFPVFEIVAPQNRFQDVHIEEANNCESDGDDGRVDSVSTQPVATRGSLLNTLFGSFTWEAVEGSGISAVAI